jgi:dephospho-CoA kinase
MPRSGHFPPSHCPGRGPLGGSLRALLFVPPAWYRAAVVVVGLTGGIGSGKSTVSAMLARRGAVVIDADEIAREVTAPGGAAYQAMVDHFGAGVVGPDGTLDRAAIAARVFSDPAELAALNAITHPAIGAAMLLRLAALRAPGEAGGVGGVGGIGRSPVVLDIPLLTEATRGNYGLAGVVVVDAPVEVAIRRLVRQRGLTEADAEARVRAQASREDRRRWADFVVDNGGSRAQLAASVEQLWSWLGRLAGPGPGDSSRSVDGSSQEAFDADGREDGQEDD